MTETLSQCLQRQLDACEEATAAFRQLLQEDIEPQLFSKTFAADATALMGDFVRKLTKLRLKYKA